MDENDLKLKHGSVTDGVLRFLKTQNQWTTRHEVLSGLVPLGHPESALDQALYRLHVRGLVYRQGEKGRYQYAAKNIKTPLQVEVLKVLNDDALGFTVQEINRAVGHPAQKALNELDRKGLIRVEVDTGTRQTRYWACSKQEPKPTKSSILDQLSVYEAKRLYEELKEVFEGA